MKPKVWPFAVKVEVKVTDYARRKVHMAGKVNNNGGVSGLCFKRPRSIDMFRSTWTLEKNAVTCATCIDLMDRT